MKDVEVIPWALSDSNFALRPSSKLESRLTIFVGALHGMLNAEGLAIVMEHVFGGVVHAGESSFFIAISICQLFCKKSRPKVFFQGKAARKG